MSLVLALFATSAIVMLLLFPELKQKPKDAVIAGSILVLALVLAVLDTLDIWTVTIDDMLTAVFQAITHPSSLIGR